MTVIRWFLLVAFVLALSSCGSGPNLPTCTTTADCKSGDDCLAGYCAPNSGCQALDKQFCYPGPANTENVGVCLTGHKTCENGSWSACKDAVIPSAEICGDGKDNDCDGEIDEGC